MKGQIYKGEEKHMNEKMEIKRLYWKKKSGIKEH